jgi:hypothetical protein
MPRKKKAKSATENNGGQQEPHEAVIKEYFFAFEILKQYSYNRSYIIKAPMKKSFKDTISELFVGRI